MPKDDRDRICKTTLRELCPESVVSAGGRYGMSLDGDVLKADVTFVRLAAIVAG